MGAQKVKKFQKFGVPKWWMVVMMMPDAA